MDFPSYNMVIFHRYVNVYQRVSTLAPIPFVILIPSPVKSRSTVNSLSLGLRKNPQLDRKKSSILQSILEIPQNHQNSPNITKKSSNIIKSSPKHPQTFAPKSAKISRIPAQKTTSSESPEISPKFSQKNPQRKSSVAPVSGRDGRCVFRAERIDPR